MKNAAPLRKYHAPKIWLRWGGVAVLSSGIAALLYAAVELSHIDKLEDAPLIVLVTVNTLFIYQFAAFLAPRLGRMFEEFPTAGQDPQGTVNHLLGDFRTIVPGILFAVFIAFSVWQINPWRGDETLRWTLCAFLFVNNLIIGCIITSIFRFWQTIHSELKQLDLRVLNLNRAPLVNLLKINSQIVMATAFVSCLAIFSVALSNYAIDPVIAVFSGCSLLMVVATYAVPILPLSNMLAKRKAEELDRLERLIEAHVRNLTGQPPRSDLLDAGKKLPELDDLIKARDLVSHVRTLPPGGQISVSAAAIVTFLSLMPTFIDYAMSKLP